MDSAKTKTKVYLLLLSLVISLVGMAAMKMNQGSPAAKVMTPDQKLQSLENASPQSPDMARFLQHEKESRDSNKEVGDAF